MVLVVAAETAAAILVRPRKRRRRFAASSVFHFSPLTARPHHCAMRGSSGSKAVAVAAGPREFKGREGGGQEGLPPRREWGGAHAPRTVRRGETRWRTPHSSSPTGDCARIFPPPPPSHLPGCCAHLRPGLPGPVGEKLSARAHRDRLRGARLAGAEPGASPSLLPPTCARVPERASEP